MPRAVEGPALRFAPELLLKAQGRALGLRAAVFDVDGVLTDGRLYIGEHGETVKAFSTAVIFAGSTYTTVGFTDDPLGAGWQLLAVTMAISGLFSFGLSTSVMFMLAQAVYPGRRPS